MHKKIAGEPMEELYSQLAALARRYGAKDCEDLPTLLKFDIVHITDGMNPAFLANIEKDGVTLYAAKD